ncbi:MAG: AAA family ATPase [Planctomycetota bacterium]
MTTADIPDAPSPAGTAAVNIDAAVQQFRNGLGKLANEVGKVIVGHEDVVRDVLLAFIAGGHVLLEGVPGLGKTLLVSTLARAVEQQFSRIQFTPDLMPADITGTNIVMESADGGRRFEFQKGPVFGNIVLADEINRATPKTQSALLEAMQEASVTVAGTRYALPQPFFVMATQNPIEMEGTYPLPEAQLDRFFFKLEVKSPEVAGLVSIFERTTRREMPEVTNVLTSAEVLQMRALSRDVPIARPLLEYVGRLVRGTHPDTGEAPDMVRRFVRYGSSPRGGQAIIHSSRIRALAAGRFNVSADDIRAVARQALRHRVILNFEGEAEGVRQDDVVQGILDAVRA